jgi:hypothetical protein
MIIGVERKLFARKVAKVQRKLNKKRFSCMFPGCELAAIRSHSQSRAQLEVIAIDGHVYCLEDSYMPVINWNYIDTPMKVSRCGVGQAATFWGFCNYHDHELFSQIDLLPEDIGSYHEAVLYFLRAMAYEYARKRQSLFSLLYSKGIPLSPISEILIDSIAGARAWLTTTGDLYLADLFRARNVDPLRTINFDWKVFESNLGVSCCSCIDIGENVHIETARPIRRPSLSLSVVPTKEGTHVIFAWLKEDELYARRYISSLWERPTAEALNRLLFLDSEDTCISPDLWETASEEERYTVGRAFRHPDYREQDIVPKLVQIN